MFDIAAIDYINKMNFSHGFQRFHVKWPLNDLKMASMSAAFNTKVYGLGKITLSWELNIYNWDDDDDGTMYTWAEARLAKDGKVIPMVYRIALYSSSSIIFDRADFGLFGFGDFGHGHHVLSEDPFYAAEYPDDDLVLHFWMAIPTAILNGNNSDEKGGSDDSKNSSQKKSNDVLVSDMDKIFNRVMDTEAGNSSSEVSVIIVNSKDEEIRRFRCHTDFLAARSTVFERMFASVEWKENCDRSVKIDDIKVQVMEEENCDRSVKIDDIKVQVMEVVLQYIYTSKLPNPSTGEDDLFNLIYAADKYDLTELMNWCVGILIINYESTESRLAQLELADCHNLVQLKSVCLAQLSMGFSAAFSDLTMFKDTPCHLWSEIMTAFTDGQAATEIELGT